MDQNYGLEGSDDKSVSPYHRAGDIKVPVLLMAAKDDTRISYQQSRALHKRLKKRKLSTYIQLKDGGHSMDTEASRIAVLRNVEKFLAKHIGE
jgi:dipeptidyl aminopeptidase/acylaminoacyl peptidase